MSFYDFMLDFLGDDTPLGTLAAHLEEDPSYPRELIQPEDILVYFNQLNTVDNELIETVKRAIKLYRAK